ncbi:hypothetical protein [Actinobacillus equuli]|uniref:hypothetical protein n=1 Tax=Actinobacillus equuli TaxID=718 RepID=UPI00244259EB|nr:hypothetical protein [Actinobacillus equuli]WGE45666.1 hypothetical protein NYR84_06005 [Actinobacillus equuli subsp. haemolyticus]WGE64433.1 hypothetical protein NYR76_05945 [Actinobacillus equuli subsp. equuli]WGE72285.1 hypothetical protein NYR79_05330 [Actinobacillus equuli subsp. haemolyticus]
MEWQGINLTDWRIRQWKRKIYSRFYWLFIIGMMALSLAIYLQSSAWQISQQNRPLVSQNQQLKTELERLNSKLEQGRSLSNVHLSETLTERQVNMFLDLLQRLPLAQGGIDTVMLEHNEIPSMTITGILMQSIQFERLEKYLSEQKAFKYSLVNFQINDQHQVEFSLNIVLRE